MGGNKAVPSGLGTARATVDGKHGLDGADDDWERKRIEQLRERGVVFSLGRDYHIHRESSPYLPPFTALQQPY